MFEKGKSGNPGGRPRLPVEIREAKELTKNEFILRVNRYLFMTRDELKAALVDADTHVLDLVIIKLLGASVDRADPIRLNFLLDRVIGRVPLKADGKPPNRLAELIANVPEEMREAEIERMIKERQMIKDMNDE